MSINEKKAIHLCEINHFYCKHPGAIAFSKELQRRFPGELVTYQPYAEWDLPTKLPPVIAQFVKNGFTSLISPSPSKENVETAKKWISDHANAVSEFSISKPNKDLVFLGIPLGYLLTELLPQYYDSFSLNRDQIEAGFIQALSRIAFWTELFERFDVLSVIFTHAVYDFGFPVLVARVRGIPAYSVNENHVYRFDFHPSSLLEDNRFIPHEILFNTLPNDFRSAIRQEATLQLNQRLFQNLPTGLARTDPRSTREATISSDYLDSLFSDPSRPKVVFLTHALSDAPYSSASIDPGFATPLHTLHTLFELTQDLEIDFFVKDHPNPFPRDRLELLNVTRAYSHVKLLPSEVTLPQLKELGVALIITGWGTCTMEASYLGVPVVAYTSFSVASSFCLEHVMPSPRQLRAFLQDPSQWTLNASKDKAVDAYATTDVMRTLDWCGINFDRLESELGRAGGYLLNFYDYWDRHRSIERELAINMRIQRYLDSRSQWLTLLHL